MQERLKTIIYFKKLKKQYIRPKKVRERKQKRDEYRNEWTRKQKLAVQKTNKIDKFMVRRTKIETA